MNDDALRLLIRAAIQRHMGSGGRTSEPAPQELLRDAPSGRTLAPVSMSFSQYRIERAAGDTSCIIEPAVQCNHCGFCKCHGH
jgi:hypothetical protein